MSVPSSFLAAPSTRISHLHDLALLILTLILQPAKNTSALEMQSARRRASRSHSDPFPTATETELKRGPPRRV